MVNLKPIKDGDSNILTNNVVKIKIIYTPTDQDWLRVRNNALTTQRKKSNKIPVSELKKRFLISEHSLIRDLKVVWEWIDLPYYVSVHLVRHHQGIEHYVSSQRNDIQKMFDRRMAPQSSPVNHRCVANAQAILNISKTRLCLNASPETTKAWTMFLQELYYHEPELVQLCVKPCVYRNGICPEVFKPCGYNKTEHYKKYQKAYNIFIGHEQEDNLT